MTNMIKDLSILATINEKDIKKFIEKAVYCICETLQEDVLEEKEITALNFGLGVLYIKHSGDEIKYKVVPSSEFDKIVKDTVSNKLNLMENKLNKSLANKFAEIYKDLC